MAVPSTPVIGTAVFPDRGSSPTSGVSRFALTVPDGGGIPGEKGKGMAALTNLLTDIDGVSVGSVTDLSLGSGVTAIVLKSPPLPQVLFWAVRLAGVTRACSTRR